MFLLMVADPDAATRFHETPMTSVSTWRRVVRVAERVAARTLTHEVTRGMNILYSPLG
jgi:hypothetical protein